MSSCQFNLAGEPRVVNHVFNSDRLISAFRTMASANMFPKGFDIVDVDIH